MPELDPYQPPESDFLHHSGEAAFRQGRFFVVKRDYVAARVCYFTGAEVSEDAKPLKVFMRKSLGMGYNLYLFVTVAVIVLIEWESISIWWTIVAVVVATLSSFVPNLFSLSSFQVYCDPRLRRNYIIRSVLGNLLSSIGLFLVLIGYLGGTVLLGLILVFASIVIARKPIKFVSQQGEYEQYEGAHDKFLEQLPSKEIPFNELIKKNG